MITIGIIGGSGLYDMAELTDREERSVQTPFGEPSAPMSSARCAASASRFWRGMAPDIATAVGAELPREHLRLQGARRRIHPVGERGRQPEGGVQADGPGHSRPVLRPHARPDLDVLRRRPRRHVGFAHPFCAPLSALAFSAAQTAGATVHKGGTYVCMEGPQFSTLAESKLYRSWGMDIIGMTNLQEAKLAREAEICYTTIALVTDYDCWHPEHDQVTVEMIIANLTQNAKTAQQVIASAVEALPFERTCECATRAEARDHHASRRGAGGRQDAIWRRSLASTFRVRDSARTMAARLEGPMVDVRDPRARRGVERFVSTVTRDRQESDTQL